MSFETSVTLGIEVDQGELRSAKRAIEDELGDVTVGVSSEGAASQATGSSGARGQNQRRSRQLFRWARQRTGHMEETVDLLTSIEEGIGDGGVLGGGGGGGGGQTNIFPVPGGGGGGFLRTALRVGGGAIALPTIASQVLQAGRSDVQGQEEGFAAALTASPIFQALSAGIGLFGGGGQPGDQSLPGQAPGTPFFGPPMGGGGGDGGDGIEQPLWIQQFLSGEITRPEWIDEILSTPTDTGPGDTVSPSEFGPGSPNAPGAEFGPPVEGSPAELDTTTPGGARPGADISVEVPRAEGADISERRMEEIAERKAQELRDEIDRATRTGNQTML